jgi:hypothetical protein
MLTVIWIVAKVTSDEKQDSLTRRPQVFMVDAVIRITRKDLARQNCLGPCGILAFCDVPPEAWAFLLGSSIRTALAAVRLSTIAMVRSY